jgi:hypothetical protein
VRRTIAIVTTLLLQLEVLSAQNFFVSPTGSGAGDGSIQSPWALTNIVQYGSHASSVVGGDTVWLRGGTYGTDTNGTIYAFSFTGTSSNSPVTLRSYPGETATIWGGFQAQGPNITFRDLVFTVPSSTRTNYLRPAGLNFYQPGDKAINCVIHDCGHPGIGLWAHDSGGTEVYGCILWGNGMYDTNAPYNGVARGSGMYIDGCSNGVTTIEDNISFKEFTTGMKCYSTGGYADYYRLIGNIDFYTYINGFFADSISNPQTGIKIWTNFSYHTTYNLFGNYGVAGHDIEIVGNYFVDGGTSAVGFRKPWLSVIMTNNTLIEPNRYWYTLTPTVYTNNTYINQVWNWTKNASHDVDRNFYYGGGTNTVGGTNAVGMTFAAWQATMGWDSNTVYSLALPSNNYVVVRPNKYERGRAHIVVFNWEGRTNQTINLSGTGLVTGDAFEVRDVQNYLGTPVLKGTYNAASPTVTLPLNLTNIAQISGIAHYDANEHTATLFNAFVVTIPKAPLLPPTGLRHL